MPEGDIRSFYGSPRGSFQQSKQQSGQPAGCNLPKPPGKKQFKGFKRSDRLSSSNSLSATAPKPGNVSSPVVGADTDIVIGSPHRPKDTRQSLPNPEILPAQNVSSLSDLDGTQASISFSSNASQRRIRNGEVVVIDSSETDSDLDDVDALLRRFQSPLERKPAPKSGGDSSATDVGGDISMQDAEHALRQTAKGQSMRSPRATPVLSSGRQTRSSRRASPSKPARQTWRDRARGRYSLDSLAASVAKDRAAQQDLDQALQSIDTSDSRIRALESSTARSTVAGKLDAATLAGMMGGDYDEDGIDRVVHAMERTEAARGMLGWSFFKDDQTAKAPEGAGAKMRRSEAAQHPSRPPKLLAEQFGGINEIEDAWRTGYIAELASFGGVEVDVEMLEWALKHTLSRPERDVHFTYCSLLLSAAAQSRWEFTMDWVKAMFVMLDAQHEALDLGYRLKTVNLASTGSDQTERNWTGLTQVLEIIARMAQAKGTKVSPDNRQTTIYLLCRLAVDSDIILQRGPYMALQDTLELLLEGLSEFYDDSDLQTIVEDVGFHIPDPQLRLQLLSVFAGLSPAMCLLRHDMALEFFLENVADSPAPNLPARLADHLATDPKFKIRPGMDFAWLACMVGILDVAVDDGNPGRDLTPEVERQFNRAVDQLAKQVKGMSSLIRDTGANHISKTEAKEAMEALHMRLLYAVRTRPRKKENVFGESVGGNGVGANNMLASFLVQKTGGG